ncbi:glycosyltransferase family 4 protein [Telmatospirillum siberiense]|uniref:Glycosyl transferase family 1 n=1 Tax=Telmatospirillum siberiense TaxID=382514 RepID=A0A2N3PYA7_9PROT|nr:glycosyltransferase family 4 protein [Telmatospirillum siberiense]PKU25396.1 glycosyl transferase family 1 [Telmatospirillum siberiense]
MSNVEYFFKKTQELVLRKIVSLAKMFASGDLGGILNALFHNGGVVLIKGGQFFLAMSIPEEVKKQEKIVSDPVVSTAPFLEQYQRIFDSVYHFKSWKEREGEAGAASSSRNTPEFIWFVPDWLNVWGGGHYTLFRFAQRFAERGGKHQIIYIYDNKRHSSPDHLQSELDFAIRNCKLEVIVDPKKLPPCEAVIATTWQSAYSVRAFPFAKNKFYFMQDYESLFYPWGTASMQANATYGFGFRGITGGTWLRQIYEGHGGVAENYRFAADKDIFYPASPGAKVRADVKRLFFYGRPSTERRCFELGMASLNKIAEIYPDVEIVIAGLDLDVPPPFKATLLGNQSLQATGDLYRSCDVGLAFSGTNLSYLPVELMACGVPVLTNRGPHVEWHCHHDENSYLIDPVPEAVVAGFQALYENLTLRQKLVDGGLKTMAGLSWENEMDKIYDYVERSLN